MPTNGVTILVVDDDPAHAEATAESLPRQGHHTLVATSGAEGLQLLDRHDVDVVLTDLVMRDVSGLEILKNAKQKRADVEVIVMTGYASVETAVEAMREGAADYLRKPLNLHELRAKVEKAVEKQRLQQSNIELQKQLDAKYGFGQIVGSSQPMQRVFNVLQQIAPTTATVLITGESGTGKELIARAIHVNSPRRHHHFVPLNCAALSENILESELFGHEKGAFTGALYTRKGRFEFAHNGTLFLDEIGDMPPSTQVKLLRVIEYGEIVRVGSNEPIRVDVRLIAATNQDIPALIQEGKFREDLFFRIKVVTIDLPPLRQRQADINLLIDHFLKELVAVHRRTISGISARARGALAKYTWPGNVRELRNCIESMIVMAKGAQLDVDDIPDYIREKGDEDSRLDIPALSGISIEEAELELIRNTLKKVNGNREEAAKILGIGERTLYRKLKLYNLE
jgi:two-component system response regulator HydG